MDHQGVQSALIPVVARHSLCGSELWQNTTLGSDSEHSTALHSTPGKAIFCVLQFDKKFQKIFFLTLLSHRLVPSCKETKQVFKFLKEVHVNVVFP